MSVVPLDHPRICVAEVLRNHEQRRAVHGCQRRPGMPQRVETDRRVDRGASDRQIYVCFGDGSPRGARQAFAASLGFTRSRDLAPSCSEAIWERGSGVNR